MPVIDTRVVCHRLAFNPAAKTVAQRKRKVGKNKITSIDKEAGKLTNIEFITKK